VLYFSPVGPSFRELTKKNVLHLVSSGIVDVFLAHFRLDTADWQHLDWYNQSVKYSVAYKAPKPTYVLNELVNQQTYRLTGYRWFWVADDNIDFTHLDVSRYTSLAAESGASIVQPAVEFDSEGIPSHEIVLAYTGAVQLANHGWSHSLYRYTDFVEVMSPMFSAEALRAAWKLYIPGLRSDFGMDQVWCRYVASQLSSPSDRTCAIIDAEHMFKMPHIQSYNFQDALAVEEVQMRRHSKYLQRSLDRDGTIKLGLAQLCRAAGDDTGLVQIRPKSWLSKVFPGSWKLVVSFFRCKLGYSLMAECHTNVQTVLKSVFYRVIVGVVLIVSPFLLWYLLKRVVSLTGLGNRGTSSFSDKRQIRAPYRHRSWTDSQ